MISLPLLRVNKLKKKRWCGIWLSVKRRLVGVGRRRRGEGGRYKLEFNIGLSNTPLILSSNTAKWRREEAGGGCRGGYLDRQFQGKPT